MEVGSCFGYEASYRSVTSDMHELKVNNLIICAYLNITDLLVSLANVKIKSISFLTDEFILACLLNSNTMIRLS